jgi:hypothetical protein
LRKASVGIIQVTNNLNARNAGKKMECYFCFLTNYLQINVIKQFLFHHKILSYSKFIFRITLFTSSNVVEHKSGQVSHSFGWQKRSRSCQSRATNNVDCTSLFIEPVDWMSLTLLGSVEGKVK